MVSQTSGLPSTPKSPLPQIAGVAAVTMADPACRFIFRGAAEAAQAASAALGVTLPTEPCRAQRQGARAALWLGPDEWMLFAPLPQAQTITAAIAEKLAGVPHALVEISERNQALLLDGPGSEDALAAGCPLDLDIAAYPADACTRTLFGKSEIVLWRTGLQSFHIEVVRSFLPYVAGLLNLAIRDTTAMARPDGYGLGASRRHLQHSVIPGPHARLCMRKWPGTQVRLGTLCPGSHNDCHPG